MIIKAGVDQLGLGVGSLGTAGIAAYSLKRVLDTPFDPEVLPPRSSSVLIDEDRVQCTSNAGYASVR